jgi:hypothetical protein
LGVEQRENERIAWLGLAAVYVFSAIALFSDYEKRAFDSYVHMFFADHYAHSWFHRWEPRWYGGFSVTSYPPLAHQMVALGSKVLGLEWSYLFFSTAAMALMPFAVARLAQNLGGPRAARIAFFIAAVFPTAMRFGYVYGQFAMISAAPPALFAISELHRYFEQGRRRSLAMYVAAVGATAAIHHISTIFLAGGCLVIALVQIARTEGRRQEVLQLLGRGLLAAGLAAVTIVVVILPFWKFAAMAPQVEIPHFSRDPIWDRTLGVAVVEQVAISALSLGLLIFAVWRRDPSLAFAAAATVFLSIISMGDTTPLPRLLFRSQHRWLTYDKFHYWAALFLAATLGLALSRLQQRLLLTLSITAGLLLPATMVAVAHKASDEVQPEFLEDIEPIVAILNGPGAEAYRHLFLGFGDQFCRIDIRSKSPNVDGDYHTARTSPLLRQSGIGTLDTSKYYDAGKRVLNQVLEDAPALSLRWVFANDLWYEPILLEAGFDLKEVWPNGVTLYENSNVPRLPAISLPPSDWLDYLWGIVPLSCLGFWLLVAAWPLATRQSGR